MIPFVRRATVVVSTIAAIVLFASGVERLRAETQPVIALTGHVSTPTEATPEGVIVRAKRDGSSVTISVMTDATGTYRFPRAKLVAGDYRLSIRAVGYTLADPPVATVGSGTAVADLQLAPTTDLAGQLTDAEWLASMPGSEAQKRQLIDCDSCHSLQRVVSSRYTADDWVPIIIRMRSAYTYNTTPQQPQRRLVVRPPSEAAVRPFAEYLATINLSQGAPWKYDLKPFPRPTGVATHVIATEYDLPRRQAEPHDVVVDRHGIVWYTDFGQEILGSLDPATGAVTEYPLPVLKPNAAKGSLDLEVDATGKFWIAMQYQAAVGRFDPVTKALQTWSMPPELNDDAAQISFLTPPSRASGGRVWTNDVDPKNILRLDPATGTWEKFDPPTIDGHAVETYGLYADSHGNAYSLDFAANGSRGVGEIDGATGASHVVLTPTLNARARRGRFTPNDHLWFAEYGGNRIGDLDVATGTIREFAMMTPWTNPYDVVADRNGEVWSASMWTDRVTRLDPKTGRIVEYLLPHETNVRRVFVDNSTTPVTFWAGNNHAASIVKLEPAD